MGFLPIGREFITAVCLIDRKGKGVVDDHCCSSANGLRRVMCEELKNMVEEGIVLSAGTEIQASAVRFSRQTGTPEATDFLPPELRNELESWIF